MFGKNKVEKADVTGDGLSLHVVKGSPFFTIQGEGPFAGDPAVFFRLHGCPLRCFFCDTEFSHPDDPTMSLEDCLEAIGKVMPAWGKLVVITGGEPVRQNLEPLIISLLQGGAIVQIETAGILWQDILGEEGVHVIVSPKTPKVDARVAKVAAAFKYVIQAGKGDPEDGLPVTNTQRQDGPAMKLARPWDYPDTTAPVYLSPMNEYDDTKNQANLDEVARVAMTHGYRAGLQLHKYFNLP